MSEFIRIRYEPDGLNPSRFHLDGHDDQDLVAGAHNDSRLVVNLRQFHATDRREESPASSNGKLRHLSAPDNRMDRRPWDFAAAICHQRDVFCQEIQQAGGVPGLNRLKEPLKQPPIHLRRG